MEWIEKAPDPTTQSKRVWKKNNLSSVVVRSESLKCLAFLSLHKHQTRQWGTIFQTRRELWRPSCPSQPLKSSSTVQGITHWIPNMLNTKAQRSEAMEQCKNKWSTLSPLRLHIQHHSWRIRPRLRRLSMVRTFPNAADQE